MGRETFLVVKHMIGGSGFRAQCVCLLLAYCINFDKSLSFTVPHLQKEEENSLPFTKILGCNVCKQGLISCDWYYQSITFLLLMQLSMLFF